MIEQNQKLEATANEIPAHLYPEHLKNLPNETNLTVLRGLILIADKIIEEQSVENNALAQDAARYQLLKRMLPGLLVEAAKTVAEGDESDPLYAALFDVETLKRRYANLEEGLDNQIQVMGAIAQFQTLLQQQAQ